ncbi:MAG: hypothetical protein Ct9H300mP8_11660 [Gammaproteobacteria bacterium]|nr:MAG: hypothetical protein Ct9H300mP8_11660 [Gammaproteobacteria bacterium]
MEFVGSHILSVDQFDPPISANFCRCRRYATLRHRTASRACSKAHSFPKCFLSRAPVRAFRSAGVQFFGGEVRETTEIKSSAFAKGESLHDMARVLSGYRTSSSCATRPKVRLKNLPKPLVFRLSMAARVQRTPNSSLLDLYTIRKELEDRGRAIDGLRIAVVGDLRYGRPSIRC